ncbi:hypothetical protein NKR19_g4139 [Coniochaeta hoffmannii]|uniref:Uncharacterized protein n=1 Tax=Coniochaeta hoffmannii TaxID=91930 RepID=A0AA38RU73_9PEZI|nr:hypothetical protein NKR19_g4139 [Coniochaeta hoffmannii]
MEVSRQLQLVQTNSDIVRRSSDTLVSSNQSIKAAYDNFKEGMAKVDEFQTTVMTLKAQCANLSVEMGRVYGHLRNSTTEIAPSLAQSIQDMHSQHERMTVLINEMELLVARTKARHVSEAGLAYSCTHQTINTKIERLGRRISNLEHRFTKSLQKLPLLGKTVAADEKE